MEITNLKPYHKGVSRGISTRRGSGLSDRTSVMPISALRSARVTMTGAFSSPKLSAAANTCSCRPLGAGMAKRAQQLRSLRPRRPITEQSIVIRATGLARSTFKSQGRVPYCLSFRSIDLFAVPPVYDCCLRKGAVSIGVGSARKPLKRGRHLKARLEFSPQKRGDQFLEQGAQRSLLGLGQRRYGSAGSARSVPLTREWCRKP